MSDISGCSKKILAVALAAFLLTPSPALWAQVTQAQVSQTPVPGVSGVSGVVKVYNVQLAPMNIAAPSSLSGIPGLSANPTVKAAAQAQTAVVSPAAAAAAPIAAPSAMSVERHPVIAILNGLQRAGVSLPDKLDTPQDLAKLKSAAEALPEGTARQNILTFVEAMSAPKGSEGAASGRLFDNNGVKIVADGLMPAAQAAEPQGFWASLSRSRSRLVPSGLKRYAAEKVEAARPKAGTVAVEKLQVPIERLRWSPKAEDLPASTAELAASDHQVIGQDRALRAMLFGFKMAGPGYNVVVTGPDGSGRETAVRHILGELAPTMATPKDMAVLTNVENKDRPLLFRLPAGSAPALKKAIATFYDRFAQLLPQALEGGSAAEAKKQLQDQFQAAALQRQQELDAATSQIKFGPNGRYGLVVRMQQSEEGVQIFVAPTVDGATISEESLQDLLAKGTITQAEWAQVQKELQPIAGKVVEQYKAMIMQNQKDYQAVAEQIALVDGQMVTGLVNQLMAPVLATVMPAVSHDDAAHQKLQQKVEAMKAEIQSKLGTVESGPFKGTIQLVETTQGYRPAVEVSYEGEVLEGNEAIAALVAEGKVQQAAVDALMAELQKAVQGYAQAMQQVMLAFKKEHDALHKSDPKPDGDTQYAVKGLRTFFSHLASNYEMFLPGKNGQRQDPSEIFKFSVLAANRPDGGAPVVYEKNPTYENLFGTAQKQMRLVQTTNGMMPVEMPGGPLLKGGSFHKANGGFLVLQLEDVLREPGVWQALSKSLRSGYASITEDGLVGFANRGGAYAIPSTVKVVLVGSPMLKMMLEHYDEDFRSQFGALAEFESSLDISAPAIESYLDFMKNMVARSAGELLDLTRGAIASVMEYGAKLTGSNEKLSMQFGSVLGLLKESSFWAKENGHDMVQAEDVVQALKERSEREGAGVRHYRTLYDKNVFMAATDGYVVGQINGLAVMGEFGVPSRITVTATAGSGQVVSWDKVAGTTGSSFNKALGVVQGFLRNTFGKTKPLTVDLQYSFEQNYGGIDGDSATSTKIYAALSALSGVPIFQGIAVTGSSDQFGNVQAIGGANEKITGVYELAKSRGFTGKQGVIIPASNITELNLKPEIVQAVREGKFHIWGVEHVSQGIEILTGVAYSEILRQAKQNIGKVSAK